MRIMIKLIIFDLDGTLYDPDLYFKSAFKVISKFLARDIIDESASKIEKKLWFFRRKKGSMYKKLFDDVLFHYGVKNKELVKKLVKLFHSAPLTNLKPYDDASEIIEFLSKDHVLAVVTHGNSEKQSEKLKGLKLLKYFDFVISAKDEKISKTDKKLYAKVLKKGYAPREVLYVADNPLTDFIACKRLGIKTVRILRGEFAKTKVAKEYNSEFKIKDFYELKNIIKTINKEELS